MFWEETCGQSYIHNDNTSVRDTGGRRYLYLYLCLSLCCWVQLVHLFHNIAPIKQTQKLFRPVSVPFPLLQPVSLLSQSVEVKPPPVRRTTWTGLQHTPTSCRPCTYIYYDVDHTIKNEQPVSDAHTHNRNLEDACIMKLMYVDDSAPFLTMLTYDDIYLILLIPNI